MVWDSILRALGRLSSRVGEAWGAQASMEGRSPGRQQRCTWKGAAVGTPLKSVEPWAPSHPRSYLGAGPDGAFSRAPQDPWGRRKGRSKGKRPNKGT